MSGTELGTAFWVNEYITPWDFYAHGITNVMAYRKTAFQEMHIVETGAYGKALVLDGKWQSCMGDEFLYHEPLVHPGMLQQGDPRTVLILGGGEGATAREILRWNNVQKCVMIDIDKEVVDACREHLADMHQGVFDDPRLEVVIDDALNFLDTTKTQWDVIISDLSDPIVDGPSFKLFTKEYFAQAKNVLAPGGAFVLQAGPVAPMEMAMHAGLVRTMKEVFAHCQSYVSHVPTYASPWGFVLASEKPIATNPVPAEIDRALAEKTRGGYRMFDGSTYLGMLQIPLHLRKAIAEETRVFTLKEPPKFFGKGELGASA